MKLEFLTLTGADDSIDPSELQKLLVDFPTVEFGILYSRSREGSARFPSGKWVQRLRDVVPPQNLSLHVCGRACREILLGNNLLPYGLLDGFRRVQLNFRSKGSVCNPTKAGKLLLEFGDREIVFQLDQDGRNRFMGSILRATPGLKAAPLFDPSGGRGASPATWPKPLQGFGFRLFGYAGGLGPRNLRPELIEIAKVASRKSVWVDMESSLRSPDGSVFRIQNALECCKIVNDFKLEEVSA